MFSVLIVDDEPAAVQYLETIVRKKCSGYEVVATANDGAEGLNQVKALQPDVLLFDIRMPVVDGLAMSAAIRDLGLPVVMIVVSGYSEFEYARQAMGNGAVDYLLKPVDPEEVQKLFDRLTPMLEKRRYEERTNLLRQLYRDTEVPPERVEKYFGNQKFYTALARHNGLPTRFSPQNAREVFSEIHELLITYGRDEMENLYLCPESLIYGTDFEGLIMKQIQKDTTGEGYCTAILSRESVSCREVCGRVKQLYQMLDHNIIVGRTHTIFLEDNPEKAESGSSEAEQNALAAFRYYTEKKDFEQAKKAAEQTLRAMDQKNRRLMRMEREVRGMYEILCKSRGRGKYDSEYLDDEYAIEEAFSSSQNIDQLIVNIRDILFRETEMSGLRKLDTEDFIRELCGYAEENLETISGPQDLCRYFGVSQTYLGKLFRKYRKTSLSTYLTEMRMERAKAYLKNDPESLIKDISERLGYGDQFYFSRVFHSYTGMCPKDYLESIRQDFQKSSDKEAEK